MRLVRFEDPTDGTAIDFHPLLTVVSGLPELVRRRLLAAAAAIPAGRDPGARGTVEVHGVLLDLDAESLRLLELGTVLDVVVAAADLPGGEQQAPHDPAFLPPEPTQPTVTPPESPELTELRKAMATAAAHLEEARRIRAGAAEQHDRIATRLRVFDAEMGTARKDLAPDAPREVVEARATLDALLAGLATATETTVDEVRRAAVADVVKLEEQARALEAEMERLRRLDPGPVREALTAVEHAEPAPLVPSAEAARIADELVVITERLTLAHGQNASGRSQLLELTARRDAAYDAYVEAEARLRAPQLDPAVVARLEEVHDQVFELDTKASRLSGARFRRRVIELKEEEDQLLAELGFDTWSNYVMGVSSEDAESERMRRYEVAKATYEFAEDELAKAAMVPRTDDADVAELERRQADLQARAAALLGGHQPDPVPALRALMVPPTSVEDPVASAVSQLRQRLADAGVTVDTDDLGAVTRMATRWLDEVEAARGYLAEIETDHARLGIEIQQRRRELETITVPDHASEVPEVVTARGRLQDALARAERHERATETLSALEAEAARLLAKAQELRGVVAGADEAIAAAEAEVEASRVRVVGLEQELVARARAAESRRAEAATEAAAEGQSPGQSARSARAEREARERDRGAIEWTVLARMAQQRSLSFVGSVPLFFDDAFVNWPFEEIRDVLSRVDRMSDVIQVVILSDDVDIAHWARGLGRDRALVVDVSLPVPAV